MLNRREERIAPISGVCFHVENDVLTHIHDVTLLLHSPLPGQMGWLIWLVKLGQLLPRPLGSWPAGKEWCSVFSQSYWEWCLISQVNLWVSVTAISSWVNLPNSRVQTGHILEQLFFFFSNKQCDRISVKIIKMETKLENSLGRQYQLSYNGKT